MSPLLWVPLGAAALVGAFVLFQHNRMVTLRNRCHESWGNVDTELQRRHSLVPNLVETVKGAAKHERALFEEVAAARAAAQAKPTAAAEARLVAGMDRLLAVAEAYPQLKASANFLALQQELAVTEDRIQAARRFYNGNVRDYRDQTRQFPGSLVARAFRFGEIAFWEVPEASVRAAPGVSLKA